MHHYPIWTLLHSPYSCSINMIMHRFIHLPAVDRWDTDRLTLGIPRLMIMAAPTSCNSCLCSTPRILCREGTPWHLSLPQRRQSQLPWEQVCNSSRSRKPVGFSCTDKAHQQLRQVCRLRHLHLCHRSLHSRVSTASLPAQAELL